VTPDEVDLLTSPEGTLRALCQALGVPFDDAMLAWPAGPRDSDGVWAPYWYDAVLRSTGFAAWRCSYAGRNAATTSSPSRVSSTFRGRYAAKPVDRSNTVMWEPPNTIHSILEFKNAEAHHTIHLHHIMTPETPETMHYFMGWTRDFGIDNTSYPTDQDVWSEQTMVVKGEDIPMVEAQQANLRRFGTVRDIPTRQDRFITGCRVRASLRIPEEEDEERAHHQEQRREHPRTCGDGYQREEQRAADERQARRIEVDSAHRRLFY